MFLQRPQPNPQNLVENLNSEEPANAATPSIPDPELSSVPGLGLRVRRRLRAPQSSGFQRDFVVGLRPLQEHFGASDCIFWSLLGAPKEVASKLAAASPKKPKAR